MRITGVEFLQDFLSKLSLHYAGSAFKMNPFRASSAGNCARQLGYIKLFMDGKLELDITESESKTPQLNSLLNLGNILHDTERDLMEQLGYKLTRREDTVIYKILTDDLNEITIRGHIDGQLELNGEKIIFDIKTASDSSFKSVKSRGLSYSYKCQAQLYLDADEKDRMFFIFYNKNTSERLVVEYLSDPIISQQVANRFISVYDTSDESSLPDRERFPYQRKIAGKKTKTLVLDSDCGRCNFRELCYPEFTLDDTHYTTELDNFDGRIQR